MVEIYNGLRYIDLSSSIDGEKTEFNLAVDRVQLVFVNGLLLLPTQWSFASNLLTLELSWVLETPDTLIVLI